MKIQRLILLLLMLVALASCSSLSKTECLATDWEQIGLQDGNNGTDITRSSYRESCAKHDIDADMNAYREGHQQGTTSFCQTDNAFKLGEQGYQYSVICPPDFNKEYAIGYQFHLAYDNIKQLETTLNDNAATINKLEAGISRALVRLNSEILSNSEEIQIRQNIESMTGQIQGYQQASERLEPLIGQRWQELRDLKSAYGR